MNKRNKQIVILLLAGGVGSRLSDRKSKQLIKFNGITILENNIINFQNFLTNVPIQIISNEKDIDEIKEICCKFKILPPIIGGKSRYQSVYNGLKAINNLKPNFVLTHDSARPLISFNVIERLLKHATKKTICVVPVLEVTDAIRISSKNFIKNVVRKKDLVLVQTPQLSNYKHLLKAFEESKKNFEDESSLFLSRSMEVITVEGDPTTLKITYERDLDLLEPHLLNKNVNHITKVGNGFDIHRFSNNKNTDENFIMLGGVKVKSIRPLLGHSDADVLLHALTDSILGIVNKGDIGSFFPPTDKKWRNVDSSIFLSHAADLLKREQGKINNIDAVIICEKPKILDYKKMMQYKIADILKINPKRISIKGKTSESLGFIGRQEGIAAMVMTSARLVEKIFDD